MTLARYRFRMGDEAFGWGRLSEAFREMIASSRRLLRGLMLPQPKARAWVDPDLERGLDALGLRIEIAEPVLSRARVSGGSVGSDRLRACPFILLAGYELTECSAASLAEFLPRSFGWWFACGSATLTSSPRLGLDVTSLQVRAMYRTLLRARRSATKPSTLRLREAFAAQAHACSLRLGELDSPRPVGLDLRQPPTAPRETYAMSRQMNRAARAVHCDPTSTRHPDSDSRAAKAEGRVVGRRSSRSGDDCRGRVRDCVGRRQAVDVHAGRAGCRAPRQRAGWPAADASPAPT
jgi:hypothetical protein